MSDTTSPHANEAAALDELRRQGFTATFRAEGGGFSVSGSDRRYRPDELHINDYFRFEGTSDPDDMSVVYALEADDGIRGTLVDAFGPYADPAVAALIAKTRVKAPEQPRGKLETR
jgi:hypothetical protein